MKLVGGQGSQDKEADDAAQSHHLDSRLVLAAYPDLLNQFFWIPLHLLIALLWGGLLQALGHEIVPQQAVSLFLSALENDQSLLKFLILVNVVAIAPWVEELLFRGLLFRWLLGYRSVLASAILSGVFFGVIHDALTSIVPIACLGVALAWLYHRTGSLLTSIVFHTAFNTLMVLLMFGAKLNGVAE